MKGDLSLNHKHTQLYGY